MSLMGYTEKDVFNMWWSIAIALDSAEFDADVEIGMRNAIDFLRGLEEEGRI